MSYYCRFYVTFLFKLVIIIEDRDGRERKITQPFSMDGTRLNFDLLPRLLLMSHLSVAVSITITDILIKFNVNYCNSVFYV